MPSRAHSGHRTAGPVLIGAKKQIEIDNSLFPNPYDMSNSSGERMATFTFEYNQRYRLSVIEVDAVTGQSQR